MDSPGGQAPAAQVDVLCELIGLALAGEAPDELRPDFPLPQSWGSPGPGFVQAVQAHQVEHIVDHPSVAALLPPELSSQVHEMAIRTGAGALACAQDAVTTITALQEIGVPVVLFKGVALSQATTGQLTSRGEGDIDLLVDSRHVLAATRLLADLGWELELFTWKALHSRWRLLRWSSREVTFQGARTQIDLHWQVAKEHRVTPTASRLLADAMPIDIAGTTVSTLSYPDALLSACYHLDHDGYRSLRQVVDVIRLVRRQSSAPKWSRREHAYADLAIVFSRQLLGGVSSSQLRALGIPDVDCHPAMAKWQANRNYPAQGYRPPPRNRIDAARTALPARGFAPWELARLYVGRLLVQHVDHS